MHYGPEVNSVSNRNEYQEYFLGVKAAGAEGRQPCHLHVQIDLKYESLNLQVPSGLVQGLLHLYRDCCTRTGIAAPVQGLLHPYRDCCPIQGLLSRTGIAVPVQGLL
jgi:hypothetical protein